MGSKKAASGPSVPAKRHSRGAALAAVLLVAAGIWAATPAGAAESGPIGHVREVKGDVTLTRNGGSMPAATGDPVYLDDILMVAKNGSIGVTFLDESRISLGPGSQMTIKRYDYDPATKKLGFVARLVRGTLLYISGIIAKLSPESVAVETPVATVAVRGTKFLARVDE